MKSITTAELSRDTHCTIDQANESRTPITTASSKGKNAVVISENEESAIEETLYLMGIPGMAESLVAGMAEDATDCVSEDELPWR
ncbi:type II toxin-antitoxin system Phd/YefM family antitoxin [uncultured Adlercreutzia sp.]|uniref:type II toxin-antitoxin system Phd/YefM family antitoxin n=1 Tax=uncultured Adlercreutzia sp. TaxID=875803 RepID=UPI0026F3CB36|nr:type II toxin-antitoxin system Phd/YefM family antitoxin [uncultured Adlercreutzia sp.]